MSEIQGQYSIFDYISDDKKLYKIDNKTRIIELFAGYGSQAMALDRLGVDYEHYKISEWNISSVKLYKAAHFPDRYIESNLSKEDAIKVLLDYGVSADGKEPLTEDNLKRKSVEWLNQVISNFKETNNVGSICNIHAEDLEIVDTDKFTYLLTYSFPCQDISVAGKQKGFSKESQQNEETQTRSGLLWEVERLLNECGDNKPQILLMENVKNLLSKSRKKEKDESGKEHEVKSNYENFMEWVNFLESKGYSNHFRVMNASDYNVAQNRERVFMVSILDNCDYDFPSEIPLDNRLIDYLDDDVPESMYIKTEKAEKLLKQLVDNGTIAKTIIKSRAEQSRAEQSRAEQSRAEQSRAEQSYC